MVVNSRNPQEPNALMPPSGTSLARKRLSQAVDGLAEGGRRKRSDSVQAGARGAASGRPSTSLAAAAVSPYSFLTDDPNLVDWSYIANISEGRLSDVQKFPFSCRSSQIEMTHEFLCFFQVPEHLHVKLGQPKPLEKVWNLAEDELLVTFFDLAAPLPDLSHLNTSGFCFEYDKRAKKHPDLFVHKFCAADIKERVLALRSDMDRVKLLQCYVDYWKSKDTALEDDNDDEDANHSSNAGQTTQNAKKKSELFGALPASDRNPANQRRLPKTRVQKVGALQINSDIRLESSQLGDSGALASVDIGMSSTDQTKAGTKSRQLPRTPSSLTNSQAFASVDFSDMEKEYMTRSPEQAKLRDDVVEINLNSRSGGRSTLFVKLAPILAESKVIQFLIEHGQFSVNNDGFRSMTLSEKSAEFSKQNTFGFLKEDCFRRFCAFSNDPTLYERLESAESAWKRKTDEFQQKVVELRKEVETWKKERLYWLREERDSQIADVRKDLTAMCEHDVAVIRKWYEEQIHKECIELEQKFMIAKDQVDRFCESSKSLVDRYVSASFVDELRSLEREKNRLRDLSSNIFNEPEVPRLAILAEGLRCENLLRACIEILGKGFAKYRSSPELASGIFSTETLQGILLRVNDSMIVDLFNKKDSTFNFSVIAAEYKMRRWFHESRYRDLSTDQLNMIIESNDTNEDVFHSGANDSLPAIIRDTVVFKDLIRAELECRRFLKSNVRIIEDPISDFSNLKRKKVVLHKLEPIEDDEHSDVDDFRLDRPRSASSFQSSSSMEGSYSARYDILDRFGSLVLFTLSDRYITAVSDYVVEDMKSGWERLYWEVKIVSQGSFGTSTVIGFDIPRELVEYANPTTSRDLVIGRDGGRYREDPSRPATVESVSIQHGISFQSDGIMHIFGRSRDASTTFGQGDVIGVSFDQKEGSIGFFKNGHPVHVAAFNAILQQGSGTESVQHFPTKSKFDVLPKKGYRLSPAASSYRSSRAATAPPTELQFNFAGPFKFLPPRHVGLGRALSSEHN
eukprot:ANDGO_08466.mRNA.1 hypothetical protein